MLIAITIELFNRQPEAYVNAATDVRLRLTVKRKNLHRDRLKYMTFGHTLFSGAFVLMSQPSPPFKDFVESVCDAVVRLR